MLNWRNRVVLIPVLLLVVALQLGPTGKPAPKPAPAPKPTDDEIISPGHCTTCCQMLKDGLVPDWYCWLTGCDCGGGAGAGFVGGRSCSTRPVSVVFIGHSGGRR